MTVRNDNQPQVDMVVSSNCDDLDGKKFHDQTYFFDSEAGCQVEMIYQDLKMVKLPSVPEGTTPLQPTSSHPETLGLDLTDDRYVSDEAIRRKDIPLEQQYQDTISNLDRIAGLEGLTLSERVAEAASIMPGGQRHFTDRAQFKGKSSQHITCSVLRLVFFDDSIK